MKKLNLLLILIFIGIFLIIMQCGNDEPENEIGLGTLDTISTITFGSSWNDSDSIVGDTGRIFHASEDTTIFYEIVFDSALTNWFMIKKIWYKGGGTNWDTLFTSIVVIPAGTRRICGELRRYDEQPLDAGGYLLTIFYSKKDSGYVSACYGSSVIKTFEIE